jgi:CheY-like chemotaxis protein
VETAEDGKVAQGTLGKKTYDLYLLDIRTPGMNGIELYADMVANHPDLAGKVVFTTGDTLSGTIHQFLEKTGRPYLAKPFTPKELKDLVVSLIN